MSKAITREHFRFVLVDFIDDPYNPRYNCENKYNSSQLIIRNRN